MIIFVARTRNISSNIHELSSQFDTRIHKIMPTLSTSEQRQALARIVEDDSKYTTFLKETIVPSVRELTMDHNKLTPL